MNTQHQPTPAQFVAKRNRAHLSQTACAELLHRKLRTVQDWEAGKSPIDLACWELFCIKVPE